MKLKTVESILLALLTTLVTGCNGGATQNNSIKPQGQTLKKIFWEKVSYTAAVCNGSNFRHTIYPMDFYDTSFVDQLIFLNMN